MEITIVTGPRNDDSLLMQWREIMHSEGIESADAWLRDARMNSRCDRLESEYLKTKKIIYLN